MKNQNYNKLLIDLKVTNPMKTRVTKNILVALKVTLQIKDLNYQKKES